MSFKKNFQQNDKIKIDMVSNDQMTEEERKSIFNREASVNAIPNLDILTGNVFEILKYLENPETKKLMKINDTAVKMYINNKYADSVPLGIITLLMEEDSREENVERMLKMFEALQQAKNGTLSIDDAEKKITEDVNNRYLYSKYGSKEEFEKELNREIEKEKSKNKGKVRIN